jgi:hypothetical protein
MKKMSWQRILTPEHEYFISYTNNAKSRPSKKFNHFAKDSSILYLKSGDSCRPAYFWTSTPTGYTSIATAGLLQTVDF